MFRFEHYLWSNSYVLERLCLDLQVRLLSIECSFTKKEKLLMKWLCYSKYFPLEAARHAIRIFHACIAVFPEAVLCECFK